MREKDIFIKALNSVKEVHCTTAAEAEKVSEIFGLIPYEILAFDNKSLGPDILIKTSDMIYAIEHFEVDGSKNNDKGSCYKRELHHKKIASERTLASQLGSSGINFAMVKGEFSTRFTYKDFFSNFKKHFIRHYKKMANYRINLRSFEKETHEFYFLVEDMTPIHPFIDDYDSYQSDVLLNDIHFYNIVSSCRDLKGVFFLEHRNINGKTVDHLSFLLNTSENIAELKRLREHKIFDGYKATKEMDTLKYIDIIIDTDVDVE